MRQLAIALGLAACNTVFDLQPAELLPPAPDDQDGDGTPDADDNCPAASNALQSDDDADGIGDVCDNCPVVANPDQTHAGDADAVGDRCDPHPAHDGDCLVLFDTFADPDGFAARWMTITNSTGSPTDVQPSAGSVVLAPASGAAIAILAVAQDGSVLGDLLAVQLAASANATDSTAALAIVTRATTTINQYRCELTLDGMAQPVLRTVAAPPGGTAATAQVTLTSLPYDELALLRLNAQRSDGALELQCRADYGVAFGQDVLVSTPSIAMGGTGVMSRGQYAELHGIALYGYQPGGGECAPALVR